MDRPYFINLDVLDKKYSLIHNFGSGSTAPLWSFDSRHDFLEFSICARKKEDGVPKENGSESISGTGNSNDINNQNYKCNLCNIKVPIAYRNEHNDSPKHKTITDLTKVLLDRIRDGMDKKDEARELRKSTVTYFCEACSMAVDIKDRKAHNLTKSHYKSLLHDRFLNDLSRILIDKDYIEKVDLDYVFNNETCNDDTSSNCTNVYDEVFEGDFESNEFVTDEDTASELTDTEVVPTENKKAVLPVKCVENGNDNSKLRLKYEVLMKNVHQSSFQFEFMGTDKVRINTSDKCVLEVPFDNFNGLFVIKNAESIQCRVCRVIVEGSKYEHILTPLHVEKMRIPLVNMHCYRQIDATFKHCVLCNENFFDLEYHTLLPEHQTALKNALTKNPSSTTDTTDIKSSAKSPTKNKVKQIYCSPCNRYIDDHNFSAHVASKIHKATARLKTKENTERISPVKKEKQPNMLHHIEIDANNTTKCLICNVKVPNRTNNLKTHVLGSLHTKNYGEVLKENCINKVNNKLRCTLCKVDVKLDEDLSHIYSAGHENKIDLMERKHYCVVCSVFTPKGQQDIETHENGYPHKIKLKALAAAR